MSDSLSTRASRSLSGTGILAALVAVLGVSAGCSDIGNSSPPFVPDLVNVRFQERANGIEITDEQQQQVADILMGIFGTPDQPDDPFGGGAESVLARAGFDVDKLKIAAGPVSSTEEGLNHGLYRKHCVHCHGITGDGAGPTAAFLNPYPRDYRHGRFKFKSTFSGAKPTRADLKRILMEGAPGTSMPSFRLLPDNEIEALIEYVIYLSVRGETERKLTGLLAVDGFLPPEEGTIEDKGVLVAGGLPLAIDDGEAEEPEIDNIVATLMYEWYTAKDQVIIPADVPPMALAETKADYDASVAIGRELFYGKAANCYSCHGDSAQGDGQANDYHYRFTWRKELTGLEGDELAEAIAVFRESGALRPRNAIPRNLRHGIFRGGRRPIDIYYRIYSGIYGTPMPGLGSERDAQAAAEAMAENATAGDEGDDDGADGGVKKVSPEDIWHLVNYVKSLHLEPFSRPIEPMRLGAAREPASVGR
ncbi:MAG: cytochrome c [Planctomycetota bacterium]|nr:MAG: cytochrome c [Planctomycetota bacterium]REJ96236.1 MAG: cytochrome c [Planctomycetota bacterium]REK31481.1 MAG: cytochrome c [Planctomycetota bacterium]REK40711.1 MAG: cytochrome c [Planctomycetota bacterium]